MNRKDWVKVESDSLSEFHKQLIAAIPKYASVAVSEMMLPRDRYALSLEERSVLPACGDCPVIAGRECHKEQSPLQIKGIKSLGPPSTHKRPINKIIDTTLTFAESHKAGEAFGITVQPQVLFRGEEIEITDSLDGLGTMICYVLVGCRIQRLPLNKMIGGVHAYTLTAEAMKLLREHGSKIDTCQPVFGISFMIKFLADCEFRATVKGKAIE